MQCYLANTCFPALIIIALLTDDLQSIIINSLNLYTEEKDNSYLFIRFHAQPIATT